jgi:hypothetical protein
VPVANDLTVDPLPTSDSEPKERRMIGDFNDSANDLWTLFGTEVKSHDDAQIKTVKDKMDSALVFVRQILSVPIGLTNIWPYRLAYIPLSSQDS